MKTVSLVVAALATCVGCTTIRSGGSTPTQRALEPDFAVRVVLSDQAKARLAESRSWFVIEALAFGEPKTGTDAALLNSLGTIDLWERTIRPNAEGVARFTNIRVWRKGLMALATPEYVVNINVLYFNRTKTVIDLGCETLTQTIVKLQHRTSIINCKPDGK